MQQANAGIKGRRERERHELRAAILRAAREVAAAEGWQAVTIRGVAARVEYSPPMIYQYFESKDDLLLALLREGFAEITVRLRALEGTSTVMQTSKGVQAAEDALLHVAEAYWAFARQCPELYQVMHGLGGVSFGTAQTPPEARAAFVALRDLVRPLTGDTLRLDDDVDSLWATLHGFVALTMAGRISGGEPRAAEIMARTVRGLAAAWHAHGNT